MDNNNVNNNGSTERVYTVYCKKCYKEATNLDNFCPSCGEPLKEGIAKPEQVVQNQSGTNVQPVIQKPKESTGERIFKGVFIAFASFITFMTIASLLFFGACMLMIGGLGR